MADNAVLRSAAGHDTTPAWEMYQACYRGDVEAVERVHRQGVNLDTDLLGQRLLNLAASRGKARVVKYLLQHGVDVNKADDGGHIPLHIAVSQIKPRVVNVLLRANVDVNTPWKGKMTATMAAATQASSQILQALINSKADLTVKDHNGNQALFYAINSNRVEAVDLLLRAGASSICCEPDESQQMTAVTTAIERGVPEILRFLLKHECIDVNEHFTSRCERNALLWITGWTMIHPSSIDCAKMLLEAPGIQVDDTIDVDDIKNVTALTMAVDFSNEAMVKLLLSHGADPNWEYDAGIPLVVCASVRGQPRILRALLDARADPHACKVDEGRSALEMAETYGQRACAEVLTIEMAKRDAPVVREETVRLAAERRREEILARDDQDRIRAEKHAREQRKERHNKALAAKAEVQAKAEDLAAQRSIESSPPSQSPSSPPSSQPSELPQSPPRPQPPRPKAKLPDKKTVAPRKFIPRCDNTALPRLSSTFTLADYAPKLTIPPPRGASPKHTARASTPPPSPQPHSDSQQSMCTPYPPPSPPSPIPTPSKRRIKLLLDGANVGRSRFTDAEYAGDARCDFDLRREEAGVHCKPIYSNAILSVFQHIMQANVRSNVEFVPMIFVHMHVLDGGKNQAMYAFQSHKLLADDMKGYVTAVPSYRDDDIAQLTYLKRENESGRPTFVVSNDLFVEHVKSGLVTAEMLKKRLISFTFLGDTSNVLLIKPDCEELAEL